MQQALTNIKRFSPLRLIALWTVLFVLGGMGNLMGQTTPFTTSTTWTVPAGVTCITVECWGGGGGGGGAKGSSYTDVFGDSGYYSAGGGGGGGGAYSKSQQITVTPGQTITVTVGNAGTAGTTGGGSGGNGGTSSIVVAGVTYQALGGAGGEGRNSTSGNGAGAGGNGGAAETNGTLYSIMRKGGNGASGLITGSFNFGGSGGGAGGVSSNGGNATIASGTTASVPGTSGGAPSGGGGQGQKNGGIGSVGSAVGNTIGGGGGGGSNPGTGTTGFAGKAGALGEVRITVCIAACTAPTSVALSGFTSSICSGSNPGTLTATATGGSPTTYSYLWYRDAVSTGVTTQTYAPGNLTANTSIYCVVSTGSGCSTTSPTTTINVASPPTSVTLSATNTTFCAGGSTVFSTSLSGGSLGGGSWEYRFELTSGDVLQDWSTNSTYSPTGIGAATYNVVVKVRSSACTSLSTTSNTVVIIANSLSVAPTSVSGTNSICAGSSTTLTTNGGSLGYEAEDLWYSGACPTDYFSQEWATQPYLSFYNTTVNSVSNGILNVTSTGNDPMIEMYGLGSFNPTSARYINIRYRVNVGTAGYTEIFFTNSTYTVATGIQDYTNGALISDGQWHVLSIDMPTVNAAVNGGTNYYNTGGNITGWRFDWATASGVTMDIDFITLSSSPIVGTGTTLTVSPASTTTYYTLKKGGCNTTTCASTMVTITPSIDFANTQLPTSATICTGGSQTIYGKIFINGVTVNAGATAGLVAELGYSTTNSNPNTWTNWQAATFNAQVVNDDEYVATLTGLAAGTYYYAFRYSYNGCAYTYGGTGGIWSSNSGVLTVNDCFGTYASAPNLTSCNTSVASQGAFYNTSGSGANLINSAGTNYNNYNFGSYFVNSGGLVLKGAELKTWRNTSSGNVCSAKMYYSIYPTGSPTGVFTMINLPYYDGCSSGAFPTGGPCNNGDQKWRDIAQNINLTTFAAGSYTLEVYYELTGSHTSTSGCGTTQYLNNNGSNYTATFTLLAAPTASNTGPYCEGTGTVTLSSSNGGTSYSWSGPNAFANATQNPTNGVPSTTNAGTYTVTVNIGGCTQTAQTTVTVNPPTTPTFTQVAAICSGGSLSALPTTSNNGITGTWSPVLNNTATTLYTFTPTAGQCAGSTTLTISIFANPSLIFLSPP